MRNMWITVTSIWSHYQTTCHHLISNATIGRRIVASWLRFRKPLRVHSYLTSRLEWAHVHQNWLLSQWLYVFFCFDGRWLSNWSLKKKRVQRLVVKWFHLRAEVSFFGVDSCMDLLWYIFLSHSLEKFTYILIRPIVQPIGGEVGPNFVFMENNAHRHHIQVAQNVLREGETEIMATTSSRYEPN